MGEIIDKLQFKMKDKFKNKSWDVDRIDFDEKNIFMKDYRSYTQSYFSFNDVEVEMYIDGVNILKELDTRDQMINLLCKLLEKYGGMNICDEISIDECTLECKTCIKDIIRKKVKEEMV